MKSVLTKHKEKAQKVFNEWVRLKSCLETTGSPFAAICFTCGKETENMNGKLHAGHWIKDSKNGNSTSFDIRNVNPQCLRCNHILGGNDTVYTLNMIKKYGQDEIEALHALKLTSKKWTIDELDEIYITYKEKIKNIYG